MLRVIQQVYDLGGDTSGCSQFPISGFRAYVTPTPALNPEFGNNLMCHPVAALPIRLYSHLPQ